MSQNEVGKSHGLVIWVLFLGLAIAIGGNIYESTCRDQLAHDLARKQAMALQQMAKLDDTTRQALLKTNQRFDALENEVESAPPVDSNLRQVRSELKKSNAQLADGIEQKRQQVMGELSNLRADTEEKLGRISGDLENTSSDVKRVESGLSDVSSLAAENSKGLADLKELGERTYLDFDLGKTKEPKKIGEIRLMLKKTDPKRSRYTVAVLTNDKLVEKKDRSVNEPLLLYVDGSRRPYEIIITQVKKNEVVGYLAAPKIKPARS